MFDQTRDVRNRTGLYGRGAEYHVGHDWENGNAFKYILDDFVSMKSLDLESLRIEKRNRLDYKVPYLADA